MTDDFFDNLKKAEKEVRKNKKKYNYIIRKFAGCYNCKHMSKSTIESQMECEILHPKKEFHVSELDYLGICDYYIQNLEQ